MWINTVLILQALATTYMAGLIWFVQVVHYPLFAEVGMDHFCAYEKRHIRATGMVVGPAMLLEMASSIALALLRPGQSIQLLNAIGIGLLLLIWLSTWTLQVPCHRSLERTHDAGVIRKLVMTNWLRTVCWTIRMLLVATILFLMLNTSLLGTLAFSTSPTYFPDSP